MLEFNYKIVVVLEFLDGTEEFVIWEPKMYGDMIKHNVNFTKMFYESPEIVSTPPLFVNLFLYNDPKVVEVDSTVGDKLSRREILMGENLFFITSY
jgi:hypothetical protein